MKRLITLKNNSKTHLNLMNKYKSNYKKHYLINKKI